jgi:hypothetical protein
VSEQGLLKAQVMPVPEGAAYRLSDAVAALPTSAAFAVAAATAPMQANATTARRIRRPRQRVRLGTP